MLSRLFCSTAVSVQFTAGLFSVRKSQITSDFQREQQNGHSHLPFSSLVCQLPSLAISLLPEYRNNGIGTALMKKMLSSLRKLGYKGVSLSVQKQNYACSMYRKLGFKTIQDKDEEYIMAYSM